MGSGTGCCPRATAGSDSVPGSASPPGTACCAGGGPAGGCSAGVAPSFLRANEGMRSLISASCVWPRSQQGALYFSLQGWPHWSELVRSFDGVFRNGVNGLHLSGRVRLVKAAWAVISYLTVSGRDGGYRDVLADDSCRGQTAG